MAVSRETVKSWNLLQDAVSSSQYYKHIFYNEGSSVLNNSLSGFASLLFSTKKIKDESGFVIVAENDTDAEQLYLSLDDLLPGSVYYAANNRNDHSRPVFFASEDERNFESAYTAILSEKKPVIITPSTALKVRVNCKNGNIGKIIFKKGAKASMVGQIKLLERWGYESVDSTITPKSFCVRGGIVDIFPLYASRPVRVEYYGDKVESIRTFNPVSQLSIKNINEVELFAPSGSSSNEKVSFLDFLRASLKQFFYLKREVSTITIANNSSYDGVELDADCVSCNLDNIQNGSDHSIFVFGNINSTYKNFDSVYELINVINKPLRSGFSSGSLGLTVFGYLDLNAARPRIKNKPVYKQGSANVFTLSNIGWGDHVVHEDYGVGIYRGLSFVTHKDHRQDCVSIEYADGGVVRVPLDGFNKIHKYVSSGKGSTEISNLGKRTWKNQIAKAKQTVRVIVEDLIDIHSSRQQPRSFSYTSDNEFLELLAETFPFDTTPDQQKAIMDVLQDLDKTTPMDRVVLGDVGFGKTEVAFRAVMKVIASGKQVFFLAPTTVLTDQHYINAKSRFGNLGVKIELLSRFQSKKAQLSIVDKIKSRATDLVIGTHKLLSNDVSVENLGLLIIDEEHRFGVKHKERVRLLKKDVDVLTLTATPIPRTLQQSLLGVRDISRIDSPPLERQSIKTVVQYFSWESVKEQIEREVRRGGQVYFLHNDIQSIPFVVEKIMNLFPNCAVAPAHGSLPSKKLENTILSFFNGGVDILVCTTIIESGLDVTNANTVIINNSHRFGLAQLYQIRGRVGRGNLQAYCWLLIPKKTLNKNAYQRLKTIEHFSALGSGYQIALKDLEIRGAGNVFGYEQSGHINRVGYDMYCKLLKEEVEKHVELQKSGKKEYRPVIVFRGPAFFPDSYMPLVQDRVFFYRLLSLAEEINTVNSINDEIIDRFGRMPHEANNVVTIAKIRESFTGLGIKKVSLNNASVVIRFSGDRVHGEFNLNGLQKILAESKRDFRFVQNGDFAASIKTSSYDDAFAFVYYFAELIKTNLL
ncbi:MAG: hypothetical protein CMG29_02705 [Candidatus Marinimicrobia bacterium]|nr:hypothetical protein [Candidatus Neomarinimicrobiota bacterium]